MIRQIALTTLTFALVVPAIVADTGQSGSVSGTVVDSAGIPIASALVTYSNVAEVKPSRTGTLAPSGPTTESTISTGQDGTFSVSPPPGTYHFCAAGVKANQLGTCGLGGMGATPVELAAGQTVQGLTLQVVDGALVAISVQDVSGKIHELTDTPTVDGHMPLSGANFAVGVLIGSWYARVPLLSTQDVVRQYQLAVPKNASVQLYLDTALAVTDEVATPVPTRQPGTAVPVNGQSTIAFSLVVP